MTQQVRRTMSAPPTGCRVECWECGIPVYYDRYFECSLCIDCWNFYKPLNVIMIVRVTCLVGFFIKEHYFI